MLQKIEQPAAQRLENTTSNGLAEGSLEAESERFGHLGERESSQLGGGGEAKFKLVVNQKKTLSVSGNLKLSHLFLRFDMSAGNPEASSETVKGLLRIMDKL